ncbi:MAG: phage holin family protein [Nitriliruptorales bacterium]|nr:phage holin family protein [Nitriliruptorales bacterium]
MSPTPEDQSMGELFGRVTSDLSALVRQEMQLAKVEIKQEVRTAGKAGGLIGGGAFAGYVALLFVSVAVALLIATVLPDGMSETMRHLVGFVIVGVVYGIAAAVLLSKGKRELDQVDPVPQQTVETLKEDVQWAKTRTK